MEIKIQTPLSDHYKELSIIEALLLCYISQNIEEDGNFIETDLQISKALNINIASIPTLLNKLLKIIYIEQVYNEENKRVLRHVPVPKDSKVTSKVGFIYIAIDTALPQYIKIGYSGDTKQREGTLKAEKPTIQFVKRFIGSRDQEQAVHRYLTKFRVRGEWFETTVEVGEKAVKKILGI